MEPQAHSSQTAASGFLWGSAWRKLQLVIAGIGQVTPEKYMWGCCWMHIPRLSREKTKESYFITIRQILASPSWSEPKELTGTNETLGSPSCCTKAVIRDAERAQLQASSAAPLQCKPPGQPGKHSSSTHPFHWETETVWHRHSLTQASSPFAASPRPSRGALLLTQMPQPWRRVAWEDLFPWS